MNAILGTVGMSLLSVGLIGKSTNCSGWLLGYCVLLLTTHLSLRTLRLLLSLDKRRQSSAFNFIHWIFQHHEVRQ